MASSVSVALGTQEVSPAAAEVLRSAALDSQIFFARHARGDWGDVPDWLRRDNDNAVQYPTHNLNLQSRYDHDGLPTLLVISSRDRTRTRLMLLSEHGDREISVREGYALWAADYNYPNPLIAVEEPVIEPILRRLLPVSSAIDVGTGTGRLAQKLAQGGVSEVLGLDATPEMLNVARATVQRDGLTGVRFAQWTAGENGLPCASETFDLLTCGLMLSHVSDLVGTVQEYVRVVGPGGHLLLTDFHPAVAQFGWRPDYVTPDARYLLPGPLHTRQEYLDALTDAECLIQEVHDIALGGEPYGDVSSEAIAAKGLPPLCLVILAQKGTH